VKSGHDDARPFMLSGNPPCQTPQMNQDPDMTCVFVQMMMLSQKGQGGLQHPSMIEFSVSLQIEINIVPHNFDALIN
jgi:hypothetical protein